MPPVYSAGLRPDAVRFGGLPTGYVNSVGDVGDGHFFARPSGKQRLENAPAYLAVKPADAVDASAAANGEVRHVERFRWIVGIAAPQAEHLLEGNSQSLLGVLPEVLVHQIRRETIKSGFDRRVRGEEISTPSRRQGDVERLLVIGHPGARPLQDGEGRMTFVQMADLRSNPQGAQQSPTSQPQHHFLPQPQDRSASVELAGD